MFDRWRQRLAAWLAPASASTRTQRMYAMGRPGRTTSGWGSATTSEDAELSSSLRTARNRSRELIRDAAYAKRAKVIVQNNVVGSGIGMQAKVGTARGGLSARVNDGIESAWEKWARKEYCHTGGTLNFADLERQIMGQVFEAGEIFIRLHQRRFGGSAVPLALEIIEPERIADEFQPSPVEAGAQVRLGIEVDAFGRPLAYWMRSMHPGDLRAAPGAIDRLERVPAEQIIHLRIIDRWPQTRGIPWMHAAGRKLTEMDGLTEAEITAARGASCYMGFVETPTGDVGYIGEEQSDGSLQTELEPGVIQRLAAGEKFNAFTPTRPNTQIDPFMRMMLREVAAGVGCSYESLSRDYSQSNYSSSRLALLDDRDLWRVLQGWFLRNFREVVHRLWLQQAVLARAIPEISIAEYAQNPQKFEAVRFKPRGWSWVDPTKEVEAYKEAILNGFTTVSAVIAQTADGRDLEDVLEERAQELELMEGYGLTFATDPLSASDGQDQEEGDQIEMDAAVDTAEKMLRRAGGRYGKC